MLNVFDRVHAPFLMLTAASLQSIVLENISHPFSKPCILDIKLGTVLYDHTASEDKKERMIKAARETTSLETGVRLTGFMVRHYYEHAHCIPHIKILLTPGSRPYNPATGDNAQSLWQVHQTFRPS